MKINDLIEVEINGVLKSAEVVSILERDDDKFVIYSVKENELSKLYVSKMIEEAGHITLEDTNDHEIQDYVLKLISRKVKSISKANKNNIKAGYEKSPKRDDIITVSSFGNTKVTEKNMEDAINIMKAWSEDNK